MSQVDRLSAAFQAIGADVKALAAQRVMPFFDSTGARNGVALTSSGALPFFDAAGARNDIMMVTA